MLIALLGLMLIVWSFWAGLGTRENNRAIVFQGAVGTFLSLGVIILGVILVIVGLN